MSIYLLLYGLEPGWLGASFGLRNCYVRIIITRGKKNKYINYSQYKSFRYKVFILNSNIIDIDNKIIHYLYKCRKYIKKLLGIPCYISKRVNIEPVIQV